MANDSITFFCSACGIKLTVLGSLAGFFGPCPSCRNQIQAPYPAPAAPPVDPSNLEYRPPAVFPVNAGPQPQSHQPPVSEIPSGNQIPSPPPTPVVPALSPLASQAIPAAVESPPLEIPVSQSLVPPLLQLRRFPPVGRPQLSLQLDPLLHSLRFFGRNLANYRNGQQQRTLLPNRCRNQFGPPNQPNPPPSPLIHIPGSGSSGDWFPCSSSCLWLGWSSRS
jgi:hypothetical protein